MEKNQGNIFPVAATEKLYLKWHSYKHCTAWCFWSFFKQEKRFTISNSQLAFSLYLTCLANHKAFQWWTKKPLTRCLRFQLFWLTQGSYPGNIKRVFNQLIIIKSSPLQKLLYEIESKYRNSYWKVFLKKGLN